MLLTRAADREEVAEQGIAAALDDPLPSVWLQALKELNTFSKFEGIPTSRIAEFLKDSDHGIRRDAAAALGAMQAKDQAPELVKLLKDPDGFVRSSAADALGAMQAKDLAPELVKLLKDRYDFVRLSAAAALGAMQAKDQVPKLVKLLKDPDGFVRRSAAAALGAMQAKDQAPALVMLLRDHYSDVRRSAAKALGAMQAKDQVPELVKLLKGPDGNVRSSAAFALGGMQAKEQAPELVKLLKDPDGNVRSSAAKALGAMQAKDQVPELVKLLKGPDGNVRSSAAFALGAMQAKDQAPELVKLLKDPASFVRRSAAAGLGAMQAKDQAPELVKLFNDSDYDVRRTAVAALGALQAKDQASELVKLLKDPDRRLRSSAANALATMGPFQADIIGGLSEIYYFDRAQQPEFRFLCYYLTGGDAKVQLVIRRIMLGQGQEPAKLSSIEKARETLIAFHELMPAKRTASGFSDDADKQILWIAEDWKGKWSPSGDRSLFRSLRAQMDKNSAIALGAIIETPWWQTAIEMSGKVIAGQVMFWVLLLYFYPTSTHVQAFFFWNRWARKFIGLGYVDLLLTWIPILRNRLLAPFREELAADARTGDDGLEEYFEDVEVQELDTTKSIRLSDAIPEVRGQMVLQGESGLGKSIFLRRLVRKTQLPIVYLPADSCDHGVLEAIQLRLKGKASDEAFLKSIMWSGGLRIVIDGLNEVTVETREKIRRFLDDFPKAHILLATQPLLWKRPPKAKAFRLQKLSDDRILRFLKSRYPTFTMPAPMSEADYQSKCEVYLDEVLGAAQSEEDRAASRLVLSNPMDLTTAARILVSGGRPTLTNLHEQQFQRMKTDFEDIHPGQEFPLQQLSESVYERRIGDELVLDSDRFFEAIQAMVAHKMALGQNDVDAAGKPTRKWVFRHDKIRDYFLMQAVLSQQEERILKHIDDPRFRGVYLMLASQLPLDQARDLKDALVDRASETKDHHLSDAVVQVLKTRKPGSQAAASDLD